MSTLLVTGSVERFAELSAKLADAFADRPTLLADAGLDEASLRGLEEEWLACFRSPQGEQLAARFGAAYMATRSRLGRSDLPEALADHTLELVGQSPGPALPFAPANDDESGLRPTQRVPRAPTRG